MTLTPGLGSFRGGSLPNVSEPKRKPQQSSTVNTEEIKVFFVRSADKVSVLIDILVD